MPNDFYEWRYRETPSKPDPRGGLLPPLDLFDGRDIYLRLTDRLSDPPAGLHYDETLAWNPRRWPAHLEMIEDLAAEGNLIVAPSYLKPQLRTGRYEPQQRLIAALDALDVPHIDTLPIYQGDSFALGDDNVHFNPVGSLAFAERVIEALHERGWPLRQEAIEAAPDLRVDSNHPGSGHP